MRILSIVVRVLIGLVFIGQSIMKLTGAQNEWRDDLEIAPWFWILTGIIQGVTAIVLFASLRWEWLAIPASLVLVIVMLGALVAHVRVTDPVSEMIAPFVLLILSGTVALISWKRTMNPDIHQPSTGEAISP
jgi:putative oxidoreductase